MNKELLLSKISDIFNLNESERENAFNILLRGIVTKLDFDEAIKIANLGVFQLKKEPLPREDRKALVRNVPYEKKTLIFSPIFDDVKGDVNSVFLTLDLDSLNINAQDDLDKVFSLGVEKPIIPILDEAGPRFDSKVKDLEPEKSLEEKISEMIESAEILKDYDVWEDYLNRSSKPEDLSEGGGHYDISKDELLSSIVQKESVTGSESSDINDEEEVKDKEELDAENLDDKEPVDEEIQPDDLTSEKSLEELEKLSMEYSETVKEAGAGNNAIDSESDVHNQLDEYGKESDKSEDDEDEADEKKDLFAQLEDYLRDNSSNGSDKTGDADGSDKYKIDEDLGEGDSELDDGAGKKKRKSKSLREKGDEKFYSKPAFLITVFSVVILAIVVYVFIPKDHPSKQDSVEDTVQEYFSTPDQTIDETSDAENKIELGDEVKDEQITSIDSAQRTGLYRKITKDNQIANQIYFDGKMYTVQISSWRSSAIAEKEVNRLQDRGFDAFIFQIYLDSKKSTWNRVRIGYFNSLEDAEDFRIKNKF